MTKHHFLLRSAAPTTIAKKNFKRIHHRVRTIRQLLDDHDEATPLHHPSDCLHNGSCGDSGSSSSQSSHPQNDEEANQKEGTEEADDSKAHSVSTKLLSSWVLSSHNKAIESVCQGL